MAIDFVAPNRTRSSSSAPMYAHTSLVVESSYSGPGLTSTLVTDEGQPMTVHSGIAPQGGSQQHTGRTVPILATGPQAAEVSGLIDQTDPAGDAVRAGHAFVVAVRRWALASSTARSGPTSTDSCRGMVIVGRGHGGAVGRGPLRPLRPTSPDRGGAAAR